MLCTDGVHGKLDSAALTQPAGRGSLRGRRRRATLVNEAITRGTTDNATALVINVS